MLNGLERELEPCSAGSTQSCVEASGRTMGEIDRRFGVLNDYNSAEDADLRSALLTVNDSLKSWVDQCRQDPSTAMCVATAPNEATLEPVRKALA